MRDFRPITLVALAALVALGGCGRDIADRGITGAAIGAGAVAATGGAVLAGAAIGAGAGAVSNPDVVDLGEPPWR